MWLAAAMSHLGFVLEADEDVGRDGVAEGVVPGEGDCEVAERDDGVVCYHHPLPHGFFRRLLGRGRDGGLDLKHHVMSGVRERHGAEPVQYAERLLRGGGGPEPLVDDRRRGAGALEH
jgi:hypothetical protein